MRKIAWLLMGLGLLGLAACSTMNVDLGGSAGGTELGANIDPINRNVDVNASKSETIKTGDIETTIDTSTDGKSTNVDADVDADGDE